MTNIFASIDIIKIKIFNSHIKIDLANKQSYEVVIHILKLYLEQLYFTLSFNIMRKIYRVLKHRNPISI